MALKYGSSSKSSKFGLRSGNGPLAFKNMGSSSPVKADLSKLAPGTQERVDEYDKRGWDQDHTTTKHKDYKKPKEVETARTIEDITKELNLMTATENLELRKIEIAKSVEKREKEESQRKLDKAPKDEKGDFLPMSLADTADKDVLTDKEVEKAININKEKEEERTKAAEAKAKIEASRGTLPAQIKAQERLNRIAKRQGKVKKITKRQAELDALIKAGEGLEGEEAAKNIKKRNELSEKLRNLTEKGREKAAKTTKREARLTKEVGMTPDEYTAYKAEKKEAGYEKARRALAGLREYGPGGSGSQTEGKMKYDAAKLAQANKEKAQASQDIRDERTQQLIDVHKQQEGAEHQFHHGKSYAVEEGGGANLTKQKKLVEEGEAGSTARAAQNK